MTRIINIGPDGVLYDEGDTFTSATPVPGALPREDFNKVATVKGALVEKFVATWENIKHAIDIMPANSLTLLLRTLEPLIRLTGEQQYAQKAVLIVALKSQIARNVDPYWRDIVSYLVVEFVKDYSRYEELLKNIAVHYGVAELRFKLGKKFDHTLRTSIAAGQDM